MSKVNVLDTVKTDATDAAYRVGSKQMSKAVKTAITNVMKSKKTKKSQINAVGEFLDTELGEALISIAMGMGLTYAPVISDDPRAKRLAKEFRVEGMATAGNLVMDTVMTSLAPAILDTLKALPEDSKEEQSKEEEEVEEEKVIETVQVSNSKSR